VSKSAIETAAILLACYAVSFTFCAALGTIMGSFVAWHFWTPFSSIVARGCLAWLSLTGVIFLYPGRKA
jgi:hypothetical protein